MSSPVQLIDAQLLDATLVRAAASPRGRTNHNFHPSLDDRLHRFLNAWTRGSYAAPHRHLKVPKPESFIVLRGELALFIFDDAGRVTETHILGRDGVQGIDLAPGVWHTVTALTETAVCFEVKLGPYDASTDKEFAPWAPREGDPAAASYLEALISALLGSGPQQQRDS
jgi:cupin fold WbuC family metalloprotein